MQTHSNAKIVITTGLALFAMFFGAGNVIFPLSIGSAAGEHILPAIVGFLIAGVGVPFLGLFAVSLYEGNYWKFFGRLTKPVAFAVISFLILIIGPLVAGPRTEIVTYSTLQSALPGILQNKYFFDALYFVVVGLLVMKQSRVVDIIGWFLSPVKIIAFFTLIFVALHFALPFVKLDTAGTQVFTDAISTGYGTMDLLASFFFCTVAYRNIVNKCQQQGITQPQTIIKMTLIACVIGAAFIGLIYSGLILAAASHAQALQGTATEALIGRISYVVLGKYGALFVSICVTFACLATAAALAEVTTDYFFLSVFHRKISRFFCLLLTLLIMFTMAILGFANIMKVAGPILNVIYPLLIVLCVVNIGLRFYKGGKYSGVTLQKF